MGMAATPVGGFDGAQCRGLGCAEKYRDEHLIFAHGSNIGGTKQCLWRVSLLPLGCEAVANSLDAVCLKKPNWGRFAPRREQAPSPRKRETPDHLRAITELARHFPISSLQSCPKERVR
jgi:hypothetical protein